MSTIERKEVEDYLSEHSLEDSINDVVNEIVKDKPVDPYVVMADLLKQRSKAQRGILSLRAAEMLDGRGIPALEVTVTTSKGVFRAMACSKLTGVGVGGQDPPECRRDGVQERFGGMGVTAACEHINGPIAAALAGKDPKEQQALDDAVVAASEPANDEEPPLGYDAMLAVSMAVCRAGAAEAGLPLHEHLACLAGNSGENTSIPVPMFNLINGALHCGGLGGGGSPNFIQELMVMPVGATSIGEAMELGYQVQTLLRDKLGGMSRANLNTGAAGGFAALLSAAEALEAVTDVLTTAGLADRVRICLDMAASQLRVRPEKAGGSSGDEGEDGEGEDGEGEDDADEDGEDGEGGGGGDDDDDGGEEDEVPSYNLAKFAPGEDDASASPPAVAAAALAGDEAGGGGDGAVKDSDDLIDMYKERVGKFPIIGIEDPFDRSDWDSFFRLKTAFEERGAGGEGDDDAEAGEGGDDADGDAEGEGEGGGAAEPLPPVGGDETCVFQVVGDELLVGAEEIARANDENQVNTMTLELAKRPTVSHNIAVCSQAQEQGWGVIVAARPGEATDTFVADFAVGMQAGQIKVGGLQHAENTAKYNQLLRIASAPSAPPYAGPNFRQKDSIDASS